MYIQIQLKHVRIIQNKKSGKTVTRILLITDRRLSDQHNTITVYKHLMQDHVGQKNHQSPQFPELQIQQYWQQ